MQSEYDKKIQNTLDNLTERGFKATFFQTGKEAVDYLSEQLHGFTVGMGGSMTIEELGLYEAISSTNKVFWQFRQSEAEAKENAAHTDIYISSANAISETGTIVNIDGTGNRAASMLYGHKKVFIIAGINKIVPTLDDAIYRAKNIAAPLNAIRLKKNTPCALIKPVKCHDCHSPERLCRGTVILEWKMKAFSEMEIIIVNESYGY